MSFNEADSDGNGYVSEQEFNQAKAKRISSRAAEGRQMRGLSNGLVFVDVDVDINHDGQLTANEMQQAQMNRRACVWGSREVVWEGHLNRKVNLAHI